MNFDDLKHKLATWTRLDAPTGFEEPVLLAARDAFTSFCETVTIDVRGNLYGTLHGTVQNAPRIMLTAHADEIGFMVTSLTDEGFVRFTLLGVPTATVLPGQRVRLLPDGHSPIEAVVGVKPGHILTDEEAGQIPNVDEMYLDAGAESPEQLREWGLEPGTPGVYVGELVETSHPTRVMGKAIDNRVGWLTVLEVAERLSKNRPAATCQFVLTVEEEIGLRGAEVAARIADPDIVLAIDTVPAGGTPELRPDTLPWRIGRGPLLKVRETQGLSTHGPLRKIFREVAETGHIPYQLIVDTAGITDASSAQQASGKIAALTLGLARRYSHSAMEMLDLRDVAQLIDWVESGVRNINDVGQLSRI